MAAEPRDGRFRLWRRLLPLAWMAVTGLLPCPDLIARIRIRRSAARLVTCEPWPEENATGADVAQLALLRLLYLQKETHRAVRGRHREAAVMLARSATEALILGAWCIHKPGAPAILDNAAAKAARDAVRYLERAFGVPEDVLNECIRRLAAPRKAPTLWDMAETVDTATGSRAATGLYQRLYVPLSNFTVHAGAGSLMRHVRPGGTITRRAARSWNRRSPARVADACTGYLAAVVAQNSGQPTQRFTTYGDRHSQRTLLPMTFMVAGRVAGSARPNARRTAGTAAKIIGMVRQMGAYAWSDQFTADPPDIRTARIREALTAIAAEGGLGDVMHALEPFIDFIAARIATDIERGNNHGL